MWNASKDGLFLVSSFFSALSKGVGTRSLVVTIWKIKAPSRVMVFGWLALCKRILTMGNLRRGGRTVVNCYPMCLGDEESVDHFLLNCNVT